MFSLLYIYSRNINLTPDYFLFIYFNHWNYVLQALLRKVKLTTSIFLLHFQQWFTEIYQGIIIYNSPSELFHFERFDVIIARWRRSCFW